MIGIMLVVANNQCDHNETQTRYVFVAEDSPSNSAWLTCEVKNDAYIVRFHVEFREGFKDFISSIEKGEEIIFRGKFYTEGCGFTDCELITRNNQSNGGE